MVRRDLDALTGNGRHRSLGPRRGRGTLGAVAAERAADWIDRDATGQHPHGRVLCGCVGHATSLPDAKGKIPTDSPSPSAPASAAVSTRLPSPSPQPSAPCGDHLIIYDGPEPTITNQVRSPEIFVAEVVGVADAALVPIGEHEPGEGVGAIRSDAYRRLTLDVRDVAKGPADHLRFVASWCPAGPSDALISWLQVCRI